MSESDYPGYGSMEYDGSKAAGERKIAHSAQMYHYQHQKQQILDLEKLVLLVIVAFCLLFYLLYIFGSCSSRYQQSGINSASIIYNI